MGAEAGLRDAAAVVFREFGVHTSDAAPRVPAMAVAVVPSLFGIKRVRMVVETQSLPAPMMRPRGD